MGLVAAFIAFHVPEAFYHSKHANSSRKAYILSYFTESTGTAIWAATCDFQQCGILTSVDSDEPVQPPF